MVITTQNTITSHGPVIKSIELNNLVTLQDKGVFRETVKANILI